MSQILLHQALNSLSKIEWKQFDQYLTCSLFNTDKKCNVYLKRVNPPINLSKIDHKKLYADLFNNEVYNEQKIKDLRKKIYKHLKKFLALKELEKKESDWDLAILRQFRSRNLMNLYQTQKKAIQKSILKRLANKIFCFNICWPKKLNIMQSWMNLDKPMIGYNRWSIGWMHFICLKS